MAKRTYNSTRRAESAERTRQSIVEAAVRLHGEGITTMPAVAEAAGVSLPTVTKYFPTREDLFGACTQHFMSGVMLPDFDELGTIRDPGERLAATVRQLFAVHEQSINHMWVGYRLEEESDIMADSVRKMDELIVVLVDEIIVAGRAVDAHTAGYVRAMIGPLAYRALRLKGELDYETAVTYTIRMLACVLGIDRP
jgi:AcrR family transcriptional regulator